MSQRVALGSGTWQAHVRPRGGGSMITELPFSSVKCGRVLDDTSQGSVDVVGIGRYPACCDQLRPVGAWRHEVSMFRDGVEAWCGPIVGLAFPDNGVSVQARDLSAWFDHRLLHIDHDHGLVAVDLAALFEEYASDALAPDTTPGVTIARTNSGVASYRQAWAATHPLAGPKLRELAQNGVDWTTLLRRVIVSGEVPADPIGILLAEHFAEFPTIVEDGLSMANRWHVSGQGATDEHDGAYGVATAAAGFSDRGLLESTLRDDALPVDAACSSAAAVRVGQTADPVAVVQGGVLHPSAPIPFDRLVPGARVEVRIEHPCRSVLSDYRLVAVSVDAGPASEQVSISLEPV